MFAFTSKEIAAAGKGPGACRVNSHDPAPHAGGGNIHEKRLRRRPMIHCSRMIWFSDDGAGFRHRGMPSYASRSGKSKISRCICSGPGYLPEASSKPPCQQIAGAGPTVHPCLGSLEGVRRRFKEAVDKKPGSRFRRKLGTVAALTAPEFNKRTQ